MHSKRALAFLSALLVLALAVGTAVAAPAGETEARSSDMNDYLTRGILSIDGGYSQEGMNAPYKDGYSPAITDGTLQVVLPLLASADIDGNVLYCDLNLGDASTSPFRYTNYDSIPVGLLHGDPESDSYNPHLYVADFRLPLRDDRQDGVYTLGVTIRYRSGGQSQSQVFHIDFTVSDGITPPDASDEPSDEPSQRPPGGDDDGDGSGGSSGGDDGDYSGGSSGGGDWSGGGGGVIDDGAGGGGSSGGGAEATPSSEPKVILEHYVAEPSPCDAGNVFTVTCTLRNTSKTSNVKNMTVTYKSQTTDLIPEGTSTSYIEAIKKNSTAQFAFSMKVAETATSGPQKIDIALGYEGQEGQQYTATDEITVIVQQRIRLEWDQPNFPSSVFIGDTMNTTLNLYNKGKGTLYNVTVTLEVPGLDPESSAFLGNMESGGSKSADIYATVTGLEEDVSFEGEDIVPADGSTASTTPQDGVASSAAPDEATGSASPEESSEESGTPLEQIAEGIIGGADSPTTIVVGGVDAAATPMPGDTSVDMGMAHVQIVDSGEAVAADGADIEEYSGEMEATGGGETKGNFVISYEDEFGEVFEKKVPVSTFIEAIPSDGGMYPGDMEEPTEPASESQPFPWWGWALIGGGGAAVAGGLVYRSRKKKRAAMLEEDVDDDDIY